MAKICFSSIDELDAAIENIIDNVVEHYYSDWKKYDRLKYMCSKGSTDERRKHLVLLARTCGTELLTESDIQIEGTYDNFVFNYYAGSSEARFFDIDLNELSLEEIVA